MTSSLRIIAGLVGVSLLVACTGSKVNSPEVRAKQTLAQMTPEEKVRLLHGPMPRLVPPKKRPEGMVIGAGYIEGVPRLSIPTLVETDASLGVSNLMDMRPGDVATALPSGLSLAASWDTEIARLGGQMIGSEARAKGFNVMLVGGVNLVRDPRGGRNFEYLGEDPLLAGHLVGAQISGVQSNNIIGTIKHYALNNQETGRNVASVNMDEAAMRESELLAFQIGIETGNPGSVMCSYNRINGVYACEHEFLLNHVLRKDWGYKGFVMSDWGAVHSTEAILAGLDQQSGEQLDFKPHFSSLLEKAVTEGRVPTSVVDKAAERVLYSIYEHGLVDHPLQGLTPIDYDANAVVAQRAAEAGIVLLKNTEKLLPLSKGLRRVAVIGAHADLGVAGGGGSSQVAPVGGFKLLERGATTGPAASFARRGYGGTAPLEEIKANLPNANVSFSGGSDLQEAAAQAKAAEVAIVFVEKYATESIDNTDLSLGEGQDELIAAVAKANPNTIVVLQTGNPVAMPWLDKVPALVSAWYSGQRGGTAIARVLFGDVNPSGHLPVTFPNTLAQLPTPVLPGSDAAPADKNTRAVYGLMAGTQPFDITYPEGADVGYRWFDREHQQPLFPFGYGLSYTQFGYSDLKIRGGKRLKVSFKVTNTGARAGADVPQVYIKRDGMSQRLIGWDKLELAPGESKRVELEADLRVPSSFNVKAQAWELASGSYQIQVSHSATEPELTGKVEMQAVSLAP
jgi:beta-glucosidase